MKHRALLASLASFCALAGCGGSGHGSSGSLSSVAPATSALPSPVGSGSPSAVGSTTAGSTGAGTAGGPRIALTARGLSVDGRLRPLLGGELPYFRIRDPQWDTARTWQLWEEALDQAQAAGVTVVSTYVPWDFHGETPGGPLDFTGPRDLDHFLDACWKRGLLVAIKPGPFINAEWPNGFGSYGSAPQWWKDQNPGSLARKPNGDPFSFDLLGAAAGRQPSYFAPDFRAATASWFAAVAPIVRRYVKDRPTIAIVQIDNETNFYFKSRFSSDYSDHGLAQYRAWLARKYGTIAALNALYGTSYPDFSAVIAPTEAPKRVEDNLACQDWFDAGKDGIGEWHRFLRGTWESLGVKEPDVLFTTNDSPHAMPTMDMILWDGPTKNQAGLASLDAYPKQFPWSTSHPSDYPFLTSFFTKRFIESNADYAFAGQAPVKVRGGFAAELEGGLFTLPLGVPLEIPPHATDTVLLEFFGHGGVFGNVYTFRGGLNRDGSKYFTMAAVDPDGQKTPRYELIRRFGQGLLGAHGAELLASEDVNAPVALVVGGRFDAPAADVAGHPGWIQAKEAPGVYGWLEDAGLEPEVIDGRRVRPGDLDRFKLVVYVNPDVCDDPLAQALDGYVKKGGTLLNLMHAGRHDGNYQAVGLGPQLLANGLFSDGVLKRVYEEKLGFLSPPRVNFDLPTGFSGHMATSSFLGLYDVSGAVDVFAHDRTFPFGANGRVTGWRAHRGSGQVLFLGTNPARCYRDVGYYETGLAHFECARALAAWIAAEAGVQPALAVHDAKARAFARKVDTAAGGGSLVFVASRLDQADTATVQALDLSALGLDAATTYSLEDVLTGTIVGSASGADLQAKGFAVALDAYGTAVVRVK